ncbi:hypothetical protein B0T20DRAFT_328678, partial [Sordaria brevicollis]
VVEPAARYRYLDGELRSYFRRVLIETSKCRIDPPLSDLPSRRAGPDSLGNINLQLESRLPPILKRLCIENRTRTSRTYYRQAGRPGPAKAR